MNADSFGSEMESKSDLEERGFGGVRMKKKTWTVCAFFFFFFKPTTKKSMLKFSQEINKDYLYNRFVILLILKG